MKTIILSLVTITTLVSCSRPNRHRDRETRTTVQFNMDYKIDLKQDHYLVIDEQGNTHVVLYGQLEEFFMADNL